jgi:hypothetical protein
MHIQIIAKNNLLEKKEKTEKKNTTVQIRV